MKGYITHQDLVNFADSKVNLKRDRAKQYRDQANGVRENIELYAKENPDLGFVKTLLSGSLAKHTALKSINDIDLALYIKSGNSTNGLTGLLDWLCSKLKDTYPTTTVEIDPPCVVIKFSGADLNVEVMPVLYEDNDEGYGTIWDTYSITQRYTSIPRHIEFIKNRRVKQPTDFAQVTRFLKYWNAEKDIKIQSFLIELLMAQISDEGHDLSDYPLALITCFNRILKDDLLTPVIHTDYFSRDKFPENRSGSAMEFWDPVTPDSNIASGYSDSDRDKVVEAAESAVDAITYASTTSRKADAIECWKDVFGAGFNV